jgi:hypothetical protein
MLLKPMYRVDKRVFEITDTIKAPDNSYQDSPTFKRVPVKIKIEQILFDERPNDKTVNRNDALYIFYELSDAFRFCYQMKESRIYKVKPVGSLCNVRNHTGDMNWTEVMNQFIDDGATLIKLAQFYWQGKKTFKPCWEMLCEKVEVIDIIVGDSEMRNEIYKEYKDPHSPKYLNIELLPLYYQTLSGSTL